MKTSNNLKIKNNIRNKQISNAIQNNKKNRRSGFIFDTSVYSGLSKS